MDKKFIIFDFDNTLVSSLQYWYDVMDRQSFKHFGVKINKNFRKQCSGKGNYEIAKFFVESTNINVQPKVVIDFWNNRLEYYYKNKVKLIKGVVEFLEKLQKKYTLVLASATDKCLIDIALKHFNLEKYFSFVVTEDMVNIPKHDVKFLESCLSMINAKPKECFMFEDSFVSLKCASKLKIETCGVLHMFNKSKLEELKIICNYLIKDYKIRKNGDFEKLSKLF